MNETPKDPKKDTKEVSRDLMHLASEREKQKATSTLPVTPDVIMARLEQFEASIRAYVDESVDARLHVAELAMTARISEAAVIETTEKVRLMLDEDRLKRTEEYRAANDQAIRKLVEANDIQVRAMTASFAQALATHEAKLEPKMDKVYEAGGKMDMVFVQLREYRREHDEDVRRLDDKYDTVVATAYDSDNRVREGYRGLEKKVDSIREEFRFSLATIKLVAKGAKTAATHPGFWKLIGIVAAGSGIGSIGVTLFKVVMDFIF